jgi:hypothetical protein
MFDDEGFSTNSGCSGNFCPATPELLDSLSSEEVVAENLNGDRVNLTDQNLQTETLQTLRYLEDRIISMGQQLDCLAGSSSSTELSAIAQSYALLEQGKSSGLKLIEPETQPARKYFERQSQKPHPSIIECFLDLQKKLLIELNSESHEITLAFAFRPTGKDFEPIKMLRLYEFSWLLKQFKPFEFNFGFGKICDLKAIAWAVAMAYRELGYSCRIECGGEAIEVDDLIAEASPSPIWLQLQEVPLCA